MTTAKIIKCGMIAMAMAALCMSIAVPSYAAYEDSLKGYWKMDDPDLGKALSSGDGALWSDNLVSIWHLNESSGNIADGKNSNTGTATSLTYSQSGVFGTATGFNGNSSYVSRSSLSSSISGNLTLSAWVKSTYSPSNFKRVVDLAQGGSLGLQFCLGPNGIIGIDNSGGPAGGIFTSSGKNDGNWHLVSAIREGTTYKLYCDGAYIGSSGGTSPTYSRLYLGVQSDGNSSTFFNGSLDEVALWSRALGTSEITELYSRAAPQDETGNSSARISGSISTTGKFSNALSFDGANDSTGGSLASASQLTGDLTVSAWINSSYSQSSYARILDLGQSSALGLQLGMTPSGYVFIDNSGGPANAVSTAEVVNDGAWHLVTATREGTTYELYVDGTYIGSTSGSAPTYTKLQLGSKSIGDSNYFKGSIDDTAIWSRALDANEMAILYALGTEKFEWLTLGVNDTNELNLGYTTSELKLLADLYAEGNTSASEAIDGLTWHYLSGDLPGDIGGTTYNYGDTWTYDGKYYLKLGSGLEGSSIPEPGCAFGLLVGFFVPGFRRLLKRKVRS